MENTNNTRNAVGFFRLKHDVDEVIRVGVEYRLIMGKTRGVDDIMHVGDRNEPKINSNCKLHAAK